MPDLRKCPFCGREIDDINFHYNDRMGKWVIFHSCWYDENFTNGVSVGICGENMQDVIDKWNGVYEEQESESL